MPLRHSALTLLAGFLIGTVAAPTAYAEEQTLWQIGKFDQSSEEFGQSFGFGALTSIQPDPVYRVGQSESKDWAG
ncbi:MAG TPA: hypothetical protein VMO17_14470, partial [Terriglobia bacterium]|nr:hypothetical protein [Terriglobia bacterium]